MYPELHPCAQPGCTRCALNGRSTCGPHAAAEAEALAPTAWPALEEEQFAAASPYDLVIAQRDCLHRHLRLRAGYPTCDLTAELRTLRALSLTAADLAPAQDPTSARDEIDAFLAMVCRDIVENPSEDAET